MFFGMIALVLLLDQASKIAVCSFMYPGESIPFIPPVLYLTCVFNSGAAFGLFADKTNILIIVTIILATGMIIGYRYLPFERGHVRYGAALIIGGALGNLTDRIRLGYVVDFLDIRFWPVFNLADVAIVTGVGLLIWDMLVNQSWKESDSTSN